MFMAALIRVAKEWKQKSQKVVTDNAYVHTREYYSAIKRKDVSIHATTWMKLDNMLSE